MKYPKNCSLRMADGGVVTRWAQNTMKPAQPTLRMMDGGSSFGDGVALPFSLGRMADTDQNRQATAGVFDRTAELTPAASAPTTSFSTPSVGTAAPDPGRRDRMMGAAGLAQSMAYKPLMAMPGLNNGGDLRTGHGGHVPGSGSGDKIPAKYEPGEFVVSNDMLDNAPGLREQLHGLRGQVLAAKGMTPEEADAKAMGGKTLRADSGGLFPYNQPEKNIYAGLGKPASAPENRPPPGGILAPTQLPGAQNGQNQAAVASVGPAFQGGATGDFGSNSSVANSGTSNSPRVDYLSPTSGLFPGSRAIGRGFMDDLTMAGRAPSTAGQVGLGARALGKAMLAAPLGLAEDILEPATRLLRPATTGAVNALNTAVTGDTAPIANDQTPTTQPLRTSAQPSGASSAGAGRGSVNPPLASTLPDQPSAPSVTLRGQSGMDMGNGISKFKTADGRTLYSNVTTPGDNDKLMNGRAGVSTVPGMSREEIDRTLGGLSAGQVTADNAIRAANLRDGVDINRGTAQEVAGRGANDMLRLATSPLGTPGRAFAQKQLLAQGEQATLRRSQDITDRGNIMQSETSLRNNKATNKLAVQTADREQGNKNREYDLNVQKFGVEKANTMFAQKEKGEKDFTESVLQAHTSTVDGKSVVDQKAANQTRQAIDTMIGKQIQALQRSGTKEDLARAKNLSDNSVNAIDPAMRQKVIAAVKLSNKVNADASNYNPLKPDYLGTIDPGDLMDMKRNKSGDYETRTGKVIPARYLATEEAARFFGGVPTNEFDMLKAQGK